ncbi:nickel pincer cofactor-dependent isomerase, group 22 [Planctomicrobium piriforme]|uniref:LarA-like N-terminal domain-containing protein n=1 Tax=Planctomicrobium piriforme TaxID=1576369 RepID=A0A1I3JAP3_9PLAN|nr:lactate racemase domain-containing protein [Planctomicrobium piriforme]SFI57334.1 protein of unknown function [Planctomicrobium piriforme]
MPVPLMYRIRQNFERPLVADVPVEVSRQLQQLHLSQQVRAGQTVAITVGSRGIANIALIAKAVADHVKSIGGVPVIIPAMGSHGGATTHGQRAMIESFGVTEEFTGAQIRATMDTVVVAQTSHGIPVHFDRHAFEADHVIVMGRIKPHTMFVGDVESGLHKMMLIGLGNHAGALTYHRAIKNYPFETIIQSVADVVLSKCKVLAGVAIVENAYDETALIRAVPPAEFFSQEKALLKQAIAWMPKLPFPDVDLLIVDRIGKNISGTGMDTNIVGRKYNDHAATERDNANCKRILVRSLTSQSKGNACGIGIAEFTTARAVSQIDQDYTRVNCITSGHPTAGMIPLVYPNDLSAIEDALLTIGMTEPEDAKIIQIRDTLHLSEVMVSESYLRETGVFPGGEVISGPEPMAFDELGQLADI